MPIRIFSSCKVIVLSTFIFLQLGINSSHATEFEISSMIGHNFSPDLSSSSTDTLVTSNENNVALAFAWQDSTTGQGQILLNYVSRDFTDEINQSTHSFKTLYAHFSGVGFFKERNYITTVGLGIGATYFHSDFDDVISPSITATIGTRYSLSETLILITELRGYATLTDDNDTLFCQNDNCVAHFDDAIWFDTQISIGIAYRF
ncbi:hypothetical protein Q4506_00880 [Colwellia sp. 4_MG-2023]|uniref:hypothetical protein n=1 Tax=unclassified Colwellia TaxID=196834 RepID=UPI0026E46994|nr:MULTISPECIES: hypothetical protein [unclassified Colwellia]MDO6505496.1 hypothetical protein [Colwellia sp. 5_MG-2023]MDO6554208.1 hypothetical protein [Colwellia sp. 4_MG-2023]